MPTLKIMTREHGDLAVKFSKDDQVSVDEAMQKFNELVGKGSLAYEVGKDGVNTHITKLDPDTENDVIITPQLIGG